MNVWQFIGTTVAVGVILAALEESCGKEDVTVMPDGTQAKFKGQRFRGANGKKPENVNDK